MSPNNDTTAGADTTTGAAGRRKFPTAAAFAGAALVAALFVRLAMESWRKWPDFFIDFGIQLYIPWRINEGETMYRDLLYLSGGPLSQYFNALLFHVFGVSFSTLIWANLAFAAVLTGFIYRCFLAISNALTATVIGVGLVMVFIFANYTSIGNYNYITPYTHEAVHGVFLAILVVGLLSNWVAQPRLRLACLAGLGAGLVFLTKPDVFIALMMAAVTAVGVHFASRHERRFPLSSLAGFAGAFLLPPAFFFLWFLRVEDWHTSLQSVVFGWVALFGSGVAHNLFYQQLSGLDAPLEHTREMAVHFLVSGLILGIYTILFRRLERWTRLHPWWRWPIWLALALPLLACAWRYTWMDCGVSLSLWCVVIIACVGWRLYSTAFDPQFIFPLIWSVFALMMTAKMGLYCHVWHYGFVLAMPAFIAVVYFLLWLLPPLLEERCQAPAKYFRPLFLLILLMACSRLWAYSQQNYSLKQLPVGDGSDQIVVYQPGVYTGDTPKIALDWINQNLPANATLAVVPTGVTFNYLTRRVNPSPCVFWDPNLQEVCGLKNMTERFEAHPPDYVLLVGGDQKGWGFDYFGSDPNDGAEVMDWIWTNYQAVFTIYHQPLRDGQFGLQFLKKRASVKP